MGALDARLALAHKQFEQLFGKVSGFILAVDEVFCHGEKTIMGDYRDKRDAESYSPERDVAGNWTATATYGLGAGSDPANIEMRLNMNLSAGLISRETARQQLPFLEDPDAEPIKQFRETMQMALQQGLIARASQGDTDFAVKAMTLLRDDREDFDNIMEKLTEAMAPPEQPEGGGGLGGPEGVVAGAESMARGGIPGQAEQAPLPPLGALMGQDSRQVS
jgi:hypothetical protein